MSKSGGDLQKAEQDLNNAIKLDNKDSEKYLTRAIIYCKRGLYLAAIDDLNIIIKMDPNNTQAYDLRSYAIKSMMSEQKK